MTWKQDFTNHTTSTAFNLNLSRDMVYMLSLHVIVSETNNTHSWYVFKGAVSANKALCNRGLIQHHERTEDSDTSFKPWTITPAGWHVVGLLRLAGLIPEREIKNEAANV